MRAAGAGRPIERGSTRRNLRTTLELSAVAGGLVVFVYVIGWITTVARLAAARLPTHLATAAFSNWRLFEDGLRVSGATALVLAAACLLAYLTSARKWEVNGGQWHDIVSQRGVAKANLNVGRRHVPAPLGETAVRILAGFNVMVLSALLALILARFVQSIIVDAWWVIVLVAVVSFLGTHRALTELGPLRVGAHAHGLVWIVVALGALLFASAPAGVVVLIGVGISTFGRRLARLRRPRSPAAFLRSPLPWLLLAVIALLGLSYRAIPPVSFSGAVITTAGGQQSGGYLSRTSAGVYLVTCTPLADATSTDERVVLFASRDVKRLTRGGAADRLDSGDRPSLATLGLRALGVHADLPTPLRADLRERRGTCAGADPSGLTGGTEDPALGRGVIVPPASSEPAGGQPQSGERSVEQTTPRAIAELARRYQPTLEVTVADRNWPVSLEAVLRERGPDGKPVCLAQTREPKRICSPTPSSLTGAGADPSDYLQYPVGLRRDHSANAQFEAFERGQQISTGSLHHWLADPGVLDPWRTAQVYFYYAGPIAPSKWPVKNHPSSDLIGLEYWFFYPYNYYPLIVRSQLMGEAPLAGDAFNVDLHQGDWEHVTVLLNTATRTPEFLYLARHSSEGQFVRWHAPSLRFDGTHPLVQAAYGGHPSYTSGCGRQSRAISDGALSDWLVCGSGRFAFRGMTTPLVDLARTSWACWPGHFGEAATGSEVNAAGKPESVADKLTHQLYVAGPRSPLRQAENSDACRGASAMLHPQAIEHVAVQNLLASKDLAAPGRTPAQGPG